jgi:hypothetical protein
MISAMDKLRGPTRLLLRQDVISNAIFKITALLSHNIDRNTDKLLDIHRFRSMDAFRTWCTDPKNKTRGKYTLVCSTAASLRQTVLFMGSVHHALARSRDQMKNVGQQWDYGI